MANEEQLARLKKAIGAKDMAMWNRWREENPDIVPDLMEANLNRANLNRADFSRANLSRANFFGAKLKEANLTGSNLSGAYFNGTDLRNARLSKADLTEAYCINADLTRADLAGANLSHARLAEAILLEANLTEANLSGADLRQADLANANFSGADLTDAKVAEANLQGTGLVSRNENKGFHRNSYLHEPHLQMARKVRLWSRWFLGWGLFEIILSAFKHPLGLMLLVAGLAAHTLNTAAMLIVFGVILLWAALVSLSVSTAGRIVFAIFLVILAVRAFLWYGRYRPVEAMLLAAKNSAEEERAAAGGTIRSERFLPWLSFLSALLSLMGFLCCLFVAGSRPMPTGIEKLPALLLFAVVGFLELSVLALALGLAAVVSRYRHKALSIAGILGGAIPVLTVILFFFLRFWK